MRPNTLIINTWQSKCGSCGKDADPREETHETVLGYNPGKGCGERYLYVTSDYVGIGIEEKARAMRPDLEPRFLKGFS